MKLLVLLCGKRRTKPLRKLSNNISKLVNKEPPFRLKRRPGYLPLDIVLTFYKSDIYMKLLILFWFSRGFLNDCECQDMLVEGICLVNIVLLNFCVKYKQYRCELKRVRM